VEVEAMLAIRRRIHNPDVGKAPGLCEPEAGHAQVAEDHALSGLDIYKLAVAPDVLNGPEHRAGIGHRESRTQRLNRANGGVLQKPPQLVGYDAHFWTLGHYFFGVKKWTP